MICATTNTLENGVITEYKGIVTGEVVSGINFIKDFGASIRNFVGGRSSGYEEELTKARENALAEMQSRASQMGANAVVGLILIMRCWVRAICLWCPPQAQPL